MIDGMRAMTPEEIQRMQEQQYAAMQPWKPDEAAILRIQNAWKPAAYSVDAGEDIERLTLKQNGLFARLRAWVFGR